jgi:hypothetical protein
MTSWGHPLPIELKIMKPNLLLLVTFYLSLLTLTACTGETTPSPTPQAISMEIATVYISPTPNEDEAAATRALVTVTSLPPTATVIPTETPYIGRFIGEAQLEADFVEILTPIFAPALVDAQPTANADRCIANPIDTPYLIAWRTNPTVSERMGCPIQGGFGIFGESQVFENGVMYFYPELNAVWAIRVPAGANRGEYDYLENAPEGSTIGMQPPVGLLVPGAAFGNMWLGVPGLREEMGFARTDAQTVPMGMQRFENGTFLLDASAGQVYALVTDRTVLGPFLAADVVPALITTPTPAEVTPEVTEEAQG